jgi:hypothetical protein
MHLQLPIEVANQVLGYLGSRPYQEVFSLIQAIQDAAKPKTDPVALPILDTPDATPI